MKVGRDDRVTEGLLTELAKEEGNLNQAEYSLTEARVRFNVASRKYAAVRDMVVEVVGESPYVKGYTWPSKLKTFTVNPDFGKHRFVHMKIGDATVATLKEVKDPLTLEEIVERLQGGGVRLLMARMVNAALMKTSGIEKTEDGKYFYKEPKEDEIPFA